MAALTRRVPRNDRDWGHRVTPIADMIEEMTADGVPIHVIVLAVRTAELAAQSGKSGGIPVDTTAEKRRAYDRERKANLRKSGGKSGGIPPEQKNALSSSESSSIQNSEAKEERKEEAKPRQRGHVLPDDWQPKRNHYDEAEAAGRSFRDVDAKADEMRLWARANGHRAVARKLDWDATFTGWMRRDFGNGAQHGRRPAQQSLSDLAFDLAEQARSAERARGIG
jgi:hypothetical protein